MFSLFSHDEIPLQMLELNPLSFHYWSPRGEFEELPKDQRWMPDDLVLMLGNGLRLREAITALRNFCLVRYKPGGKSLSLHPLYSTGHLYIWLLITMNNS